MQCRYKTRAEPWQSLAGHGVLQLGLVFKIFYVFSYPNDAIAAHTPLGRAVSPSPASVPHWVH